MGNLRLDVTNGRQRVIWTCPHCGRDAWFVWDLWREKQAEFRCETADCIGGYLATEDDFSSLLSQGER